MELKPISFFEEYIVNPFSSDLHLKEKILALALSILLVPLTLGIAHIVCFALRNRRIRQCKANLVVENNHRFQRLISRTHRVAMSVLQSDRTTIEQDAVPEFIQKMLEETYAKPLPKRSEVLVPFRDGESWDKVKTVKWSDLSPSEKIELNNHYCHPHNRVKDTVFNRAMIDTYFFGEGQSPYLEHDPKKHHGNDHAVRAGIIAGVFTYLYGKYHPDYTVTSEDVTFSQLVASGHDCARQTEGTDVYDDWSADKTCAALEKLGVTDPRRLLEARKAIADKDSKDYQEKSLIAKCVQNADCAEFFRLSSDSPAQRKASFEHSREFLDIFQELKERANGDEESKLKGELTYGDFLEELDAVRHELNLLIYRTHQKEKRKEFSEPGKNYYNEILSEINFVEFPLLCKVLENLEIKAPMKPETPEDKNNNDIVAQYEQWTYYGIEYVSTEYLQILQNSLDPSDNRERPQQVKSELEQELHKRNSSSNQFDKLLQSISCNNLEQLLRTFATMPPAQKDEKRKSLIKALEKDSKSYEEMLKALKESNDKTLNLAFTDLKHEELKTIIEEESNLSKPEYAQKLKILSCELLGFYNDSEKKHRDIRVQTTISLALEKACSLYLSDGNNKEAKHVLEMAANRIIIDEEETEYNIDHLLDQLPNDTPVFLLKGCGFLRHLRLRACKKTVNGNNIRELSFELPSTVRKKVGTLLKLLQKDPSVEISQVSATYPKKDFGNGSYTNSQSLQVGKEYKITFKDSGIEIFIGKSEFFYNQYHFVRLHMREGVSMQQCHAALAKIGLPMALMIPRPEDVKKEGMGRAIVLRFPSIYYGTILRDNPDAEPEEIYEKLSLEQKRTIDQDMDSLQISSVNNNHLEVINPELGREAWEAGASALGSFVNGGNIEDTAQVIAKILQFGFLSSQERYQRGILGTGFNPKINFWTGSGNQVFTRTLPKSWFTREIPVKDFAIRGPVMVLLDVQAFERMPYSHPKDRSGLRNPNVKLPIWAPVNQTPEFFFSGKEQLEESAGFTDFISQLDIDGSMQTETMFDVTLGPQYIRKLVVQSEHDKYVLMKVLIDNKIYDIAGKPLEEAIIVSDKLQESMIDGFDNPSVRALPVSPG